MKKVNKRILLASLLTLTTASVGMAAGGGSAYQGSETDATQNEEQAAQTGDTMESERAEGVDIVIIEDGSDAERAPASEAERAPASEGERAPAAVGTQPTTPTTGTQQRAAGMQQEQQRSHVINFNAGEVVLNQQEQKKLREKAQKAKQAGQVDQVTVAVWSDKPFPPTGQNLTDQDRDLARQRISNIESFMNDQLQVDNVESFNMADRANWLARTFNTAEAELQSVFAREGSTPVTDKEFRTIKKEGGPSRAVIIFEMPQQAGASQQQQQQGTGSM